MDDRRLYFRSAFFTRVIVRKGLFFTDDRFNGNFLVWHTILLDHHI